MAKHWHSYYWLFLRELGKECYGTWRQELATSVITVLFYYAINRNDFDLRRGLQATAYTLAAFVLWHSVRTPWLLYKKERTEHLAWGWGFAGIVFALGALTLAIYVALWFYTMQPHVTLIQSPDQCYARVAELQAKLKELTEPPDSLRNRTLKLADEVDAYFKQRDKHAPNCIQNSKMTPEEQTAVLKPCTIYYFATEGLFQQTFGSRIFSTKLEFEGKGLDADGLSSCVKGGCPHSAIGSMLRGLAMRLDSQGSVKR
jgi:hypothetical protein